MRELKKYKEEDLLFYDIETARLENSLETDSPLYNSWDYKINKDGEMTDEEVKGSFKSEAGLYPEFAKVVSIVVGKIVKGKIFLITVDNAEEKDLLEEFNSIVSRNANTTLTGFVNIGFDTPFVFKRMIINGITASNSLDSSGLKPWEVSELDLAMVWKGTSFSRASLTNIATAFGLPSPKDDITGADVGEVYWNEPGGLKRISSYCRRDVVTTINIFKRMRLEEALEVANGIIEDQPLIINLFGGGPYGVKEQKELTGLFKTLSEEQRDYGFVILNAVVSSAKGKKTKLTKAHIKSLKEALNE